ncbi:MAG: hypothetical protein ACK4K6_09620, partial [Pseudarthrobacter sp.]
RATRHYFGKPPRDLLPQEAAFFSSILPSPKRRYVQYCRKEGTVDAKWEAYLKRIIRKNHERGRLTDDEFEQAASGVESEPQLAGRAVLVEVCNVHRLTCRVNPILRADPVFKSR